MEETMVVFYPKIKFLFTHPYVFSNSYTVIFTAEYKKNC